MASPSTDTDRTLQLDALSNRLAGSKGVDTYPDDATLEYGLHSIDTLLVDPHLLRYRHCRIYLLLPKKTLAAAYVDFLASCPVRLHHVQPKVYPLAH